MFVLCVHGYEIMFLLETEWSHGLGDIQINIHEYTPPQTVFVCVCVCEGGVYCFHIVRPSVLHFGPSWGYLRSTAY